MLRCAIYTRKSTDEGLEQEFNSLDAQREACEAYIKSQKHEGWKLLPQHYDDGGYSGGSMERPALKKLLQEIEAGRVDIIVVYKVDRLTRALSDFARMVELFDKNKVSFVLVTQQFNTTTSMGRLTLNVLLSFAQFEREVTAERIRDKIAASKKKGMWMGSPPPLGYDVLDKKLVINQAEADTVRTLFDLYVDLGSVRALKEEADRRGIRTKHRPNTKNEGNKSFSRGNLYVLLSNHLYVGEVRHKKAIYAGQHEAIVDRAIWDKVQRTLKTNTKKRGTDTNTTGPHLLTGLIFDESGEPLCPTHTNKKGHRYYYYIAKRIAHKRDTADGCRIPTDELDAAVVNSIVQFFSDEQKLIASLSVADLPSSQLRKFQLRRKNLASGFDSPAMQDHRRLITDIVQRIVLGPDLLYFEFKKKRLREMLLDDLNCEDDGSVGIITIDIPLRIKRRGVESKLVFENRQGEEAAQDEHLISLIARSKNWLERMARGDIELIATIAAQESMDPSDVGRDLQLAFLAPDIVDAIVAGNQPVELTANRLRLIGALPLDWNRQRELLGFARKSGRI